MNPLFLTETNRIDSFIPHVYEGVRSIVTCCYCFFHHDDAVVCCLRTRSQSSLTNSMQSIFKNLLRMFECHVGSLVSLTALTRTHLYPLTFRFFYVQNKFENVLLSYSQILFHDPIKHHIIIVRYDNE